MVPTEREKLSPPAAAGLTKAGETFDFEYEPTEALSREDSSRDD
jgi:hypothetical protein